MKEVIERKAIHNKISERFEFYNGFYSLTLSRIEYCVLVLNMKCWKRHGSACKKLFTLGDAQDERFREYLAKVESDLIRAGMQPG